MSNRCFQAICCKRKIKNFRIENVFLSGILHYIFFFFSFCVSVSWHLILVKVCKICVWHIDMNILKVPCSSGSTSIVHRVTATLVRCFYCVAVTCNRRQDFSHILVVIEGWDHIQSIQHHAFYIDLFASNSYTFHLFNIILPIVEPYCNRWNKNMLIKLDSL